MPYAAERLQLISVSDSKEWLDDVSTAVDPRLDRAEWCAEHLRDLLVREFLDVAQHKCFCHLGVRRAEDVQRVEKIQPAARDHTGGPRVGGLRKDVVTLLGRTPFEGAVGGPGAVRGDHMQPGGESAAPVVRMDLRRDRKQAFLGCVLGVLWMDQDPSTDPLDPRLDGDEQHFEGSCVTPAGQGCQGLDIDV